ncbi:beta-ketoacyl synthase chain length factor [Parapedobacter defluvii]|uniref:beta-ketoacyl synthase chain length factor n=1 Tax=Parapedobacter defluvii TaxID=2045106 RepID=UPI00333F65A3
MIKPIYIHGSGCISIQPTFEAGYFFDALTSYAQNPVPALDPDYKAFIPALQLRRMNKSMRMALFASRLAMQEAGITSIDAVITGSGLGCLRDSERFVEHLRAEEGSSLNPTPFIQSTHNMAAAALALSLGCKGYNMTYVNNANSFESALLDSLIYLAEHPTETVLLGGVDELGERTPQFWDIAGYLKHEGAEIPTPLDDRTPGEIAAEGAIFFIASQQQSYQTLGKVLAVETRLEVDNPPAFIAEFLQRNGVSTDALDAVMLGCNGDARYDGIYRTLGDTLFADLPQVAFKHALGEYDTVVAAALFLVLGIFQHQHIPQTLLLNEVSSRTLQRILIYTQRRGQNHSVILVEK